MLKSMPKIKTAKKKDDDKMKAAKIAKEQAKKK